MTHQGLRRAHYAAGLKAHRKEVDAPRRIQHNVPTFPYDSRGVWYLAGNVNRYSTVFMFYHSTSRRKMIRTVLGGWNFEIASEFSELAQKL